MEDDRRLEGIMSDGIDGNVVLIGFPYDEGVVRAGGRRGAELGPDCTRRFLPKIGPILNSEYSLSLASLRLSDYGNIVQDSFEDAHKKLETKLTTVLNKPQGPLAVVVGGGGDQCYSTARGFFSYCEKRELRPVIVSISSTLSVASSSSLQAGSQFRKLIEEPDFARLQCGFVAFAMQGTNCLPGELRFVAQAGGQITWLNEIRNTEVRKVDAEVQPKTQAGIRFFELMEGLRRNRGSSVLLCFNLSAINSCYCPGVSTPSVSGGLTSEECIEIALLSGANPTVQVLDISEFSPAVEDYRTGRLVSSLIYHFLLGVSQRSRLTSPADL